MFSIGKWKRLTTFCQPYIIKRIHLTATKVSECKPPEKSLCEVFQPRCIDGDGAAAGDGGGVKKDSTGDELYRRPVRLSEPGKVRMGFIPEEWFQFFYPRTGVTGPYMFGFGLFTFLASKEIYVMDHEFYSGLSLGIMAVFAVKTIGPLVAKYADREINKFEKHWQRNYEEELRNLENTIAKEKDEQWRAEGALHLVEIKRQNIELQLEAAFREALQEVYKEVIHRLEYQVACFHIEQRVQKKHMIQWVAKKVVEGLPPMSKEAEEKAKGDMSALCLQIR